MNNELALTNNGGNNLATLMQVSEMLAASDLVPNSYRNKPANILLAAIAGQPFGFDPTMAMRSFNVIQGQPTLKPEIMLALVRQAGHSVTGSTSATGAVIVGTRSDNGDSMEVSFTEADARQAGLLGKGAWKTYPDAMYWARALSKLCRMLFPDVTLGCGYTAEELGGGEAPEPRTSTNKAKGLLVEAFGGDVDRAKAAWIAFGSPEAPLTDEQLSELLATATESEEVIEAEVVDTDAQALVVEGDINNV